MTSTIMLAAALAAGPDSLPPVPATPAARETVYIERVITERHVNPAAAPPETVLRKESKAAQMAVGLLLMGVGTYLVIHGADNPEYDIENGQVDKSTNKEVYIGLTVGL